jgi:hypothetical protein
MVWRSLVLSRAGYLPGSRFAGAVDDLMSTEAQTSNPSPWVG